MARPKQHEECPALVEPKAHLRDAMRFGVPRRVLDRAEAEFDALDPRIQTVYVRRSRTVDHERKERWEKLGMMCLACYRFWPAKAANYAVRRAPVSGL
jgi:hypothetical protein